MNTYIVYTTSGCKKWELANGIYLVKADSKDEITLDFLKNCKGFYSDEIEIISIETIEECLNNKNMVQLQPCLIE